MNYIPVGRNLLKVHEIGPEDVKLRETSSSTGENKSLTKCYALKLDNFRALPDPVSVCRKLNKHINKSENSLNDVLYVPIFTIGISMLTKKAKDDILTGEDIELDTFDDDFYTLHKESLSRGEDSEVINIINAAVPQSHCISRCSSFTIDIFNQCLGIVLEHEVSVKNVLMHPCKYLEMLSWNENILGKDAINEISKTGNLSTFRNIKINVSNKVDKNNVYFLADPEIIGALVIARDKHMFAYFDKDEKKMKYGLKEEIGVAVTTEYGIAKCSFSH